MPSMSYCRWHNASLGLQDCGNSIEQIEYEGAFVEMVEYEQQGVLNTLRAAARILEEMPVAYLKAAGIDLKRLPSQAMIDNADAPAFRREHLPKAA